MDGRELSEGEIGQLGGSDGESAWGYWGSEAVDGGVIGLEAEGC